MERLVARAVLVVPCVERAEIESVNSVTDEVRQVPFGQPLLQRFGQQQHLLRIVGKVVRSHPRLTGYASLTSTELALLPPRLLAGRPLSRIHIRLR